MPGLRSGARAPGRRGNVPPIPSSTILDAECGVSVPDATETEVASFTATVQRTTLTMVSCTGEWAARVNVYINDAYVDGQAINSTHPNAVLPFDHDLAINDVVSVRVKQDSGSPRNYDATIHAYTW